MKFRYFYVIILLLLAYPANAQPAEEIYQGTLIKSGTVGPVDDEFYGPFNIGFNFTFFGNVQTQFYVSTNGLVSFGAGYSLGTEVPIPTDAIPPDPKNFIAAFWDDLVIDYTGKISYTTIGAAPNRKLIIQFNNMGFYGPPPMMGSFAVILYETSNIIKVQYRLIVDNTSDRAKGGSATIGIENATGTAGVQYAYHNPSAVATGKAISFTPAGPTYTLDADAIYEGIFLTSNLTLPEPGIPALLSPPQNSVIGTDFNFSWSDAGNAASYTLLISTSSDLGGATYYPAGSNTSQEVTGLALGQTYYWGVFATNTTGTTWCEIKKFTTSSAPPLAAVPQTLWTEQLQDRTIKLNYTGGDASSKTTIITSLPLQGQLYQYNAGARGSQILSVPATVTDADRNIIYAATGTFGNGVGNFNFKIHDAGGDSPEATVTINVSPPGVPDVLYVARNTGVEIQFDLPMADPAGKQNQFKVTVNGTPAVISAAGLKPGDLNTIILTLATPLTGTEIVPGTEIVLVSYTQGNVTGSAGGVVFSFTDQPVTLLAQTITFPVIPVKHYGDVAFNPGATASSTLAITYSSSNLAVATASGNMITILSAGTSDITARQAGNGTYAPAKYTSPLTVAKDQTITFNALTSKTYGDADFTLTATASSGLAVSFSGNNNSVATVTGNLVHLVGAGSVVITASQDGNSNYNPAPDVLQTLTVSKADQTITFGALADKTYGDADFSPAVSASSGLTVSLSSDNSAVATIVSGQIHIVGAGTAVITASQPGYINYNAAPVVQQTLTVNKADQTITFSMIPAKTYGDADFAVTASASSGLGVAFSSDNSSVATIAGSQIQIVGAGSALITASQAGNSNYNAAPNVQQTLTVNKADQTITFSTIPAKTYGDADFAVTASASSGLGVAFSSDNSSVATIAGSQIQIVGAGSALITASQAGNSNYNAAPNVQQTLTVNKSDQTITFSTITDKTYGDADYTPTVSASSGLSVSLASDNSAVATIINGRIHFVGAGIAIITASQAGDANYNSATEVQQTFNVNKSDQTITFSALADKTYGDSDFALTATASSGLRVGFSGDNSSVATIVDDQIHIAGAGTAVITASQSGDANYNPAPLVLQILTVGKANLTFKADNKTRPYLSANPVLTFATSGFVNGDTQVEVAPSIHTTAVTDSQGGDYPITFSGGSDHNYNFIFVTGTLTVTRLQQTITLSDYPTRLLEGDTYTLVATSSSGLPVFFESSDNTKTTITGDQMTGVSKGNADIRAYNEGNENFEPAEAYFIVEIYSTHKDIMHLFTPNNDGINDYWELPEMATWGKCDVKVYSRNGKLVFSDPDYNNLWDGTSNGNPLPEGAYYFIIKTQNSGMIKGTVNIVR